MTTMKRKRFKGYSGLFLCSAARRRILRLVHALVLAAMVVGMLPPLQAQAAVGQTTPGEQQCGQQEETGNKLFMPVLKTVQQSFAALTQPAAPDEVTRALAYEVGKTYRYKLRLINSLINSTRSTEGPLENDVTKSIVDAVVEIAITGKNADNSYNGQLVVSEAYFCSLQKDGTFTRLADEEVTEALKQPVLFIQSATGAITQIQFAEDTLSLALNLQKGILSALQNHLQAGESYTVSEKSTQGAYNARYQSQESADGTTLHIRKNYNQDDFTNLISNGNESTSFKQSNEVHAVLDGSKGIFSTIAYTETMVSADESETVLDGEEFDGIIFSTSVESNGELTLLEVVNTPADALVRSARALVTGDLSADLNEAALYEEFLNGEEINIVEELDKLDADPTNLEIQDRLLQIALIDLDDAVVKEIQKRLTAGRSEEIVTAYIGLLTAIGSAAAQEVLMALVPGSGSGVQIAATHTITVQEQALAGIALVDTPTITTVQSLQALGSMEGSELQDQAILTLGAAASALNEEGSTSEEQALASSITEDLEERLMTVSAAALSQEEEENHLDLYLHALGNTGDPSILSIVGDQLDHESPLVRSAAVQALSKVEDPQAESMLLSVLSDDTETDEIRSHAAYVLGGRELSPQGLASLSAYVQEVESLATGGRYERTWDKKYGGSYLNVSLPGKYTVSSPPRNNLSLYVYQDVRAEVFGKKYSLANATLKSNQSGNTQQFGAYLNLGNNTIKLKKELAVQCSKTASGTLMNQNFTAFSFQKVIPTFLGIPLTVRVRAHGNVKLTYSYLQNVCDLAKPRLEGDIKPDLKFHLTASGYVGELVLRAGADVKGTLISSYVTAKASLVYETSKNNLTACYSIVLTNRNATIKFIVWGEEKLSGYWKEVKKLVKTVEKVWKNIWKWKWKEVWKTVTSWEWVPPRWNRKEKTLFTYNIPYSSKNITLASKCF